MNLKSMIFLALTTTSLLFASSAFAGKTYYHSNGTHGAKGSAYSYSASHKHKQHAKAHKHHKKSNKPYSWYRNHAPQCIGYDGSIICH